METRRSRPGSVAGDERAPHLGAEATQAEFDTGSDDNATLEEEEQTIEISRDEVVESGGASPGWGKKDDKVVVPVEFDDETFEEICRKLGVSDDANIEDVAEVIATKLEAMYATPVTAGDD